jgi:hypothetical protein
MNKIPTVVFPKKAWIKLREQKLVTFTDEELEAAETNKPPGLIRTGYMLVVGTANMVVDIPINPNKTLTVSM